MFREVPEALLGQTFVLGADRCQYLYFCTCLTSVKESDEKSSASAYVSIRQQTLRIRMYTCDSLSSTKVQKYEY